MGLNIQLIRKRWISYDKVTFTEEKEEELYWANITHNLVEIARLCGLYKAMWRPHRLIKGYDIPETDHKAELVYENSSSVCARDLISFLEEGISNLKSDPEYYKTFNPDNGWGSYDSLLLTAKEYLNACMKYPEAIVKVDR
jgi:hypothetical protein